MLDIGMSETINSNAHDMNDERGSFTVSEASPNLSSDSRCDHESLHTQGMVGTGPSHEKSNFSDVSGVVR